jgi:hypothetical protein
MLTAVEGVFRDGHVELREMPENIREARVIVTFLGTTTVQPGAGRAAREHVLEAEEPGASKPRLPDETSATPDERLRAFRSLVASLPEAPAVPLAALDRENLYP